MPCARTRGIEELLKWQMRLPTTPTFCNARGGGKGFPSRGPGGYYLAAEPSKLNKTLSSMRLRAGTARQHFRRSRGAWRSNDQARRGPSEPPATSSLSKPPRGPLPRNRVATEAICNGRRPPPPASMPRARTRIEELLKCQMRLPTTPTFWNARGGPCGYLAAECSKLN